MNRRRISTGVAAAAVLLALCGTARAQGVRPPELSMQLHRAEAAWKSGTSLLEAKARVDKVIRELPDDLEARKLRAEVLLALGRHDEAFEDAGHAVRLRPDDPTAQILLSEAARLCGNRRLAVEALDAAAEHAGEDGPLHRRLVRAALELQETDKAEAYARAALALSPRDAASYEELARVFVLRHKRDEAAEVLARGLREHILTPAAVRRDPVLARVADHPALTPLL